MRIVFFSFEQTNLNLIKVSFSYYVYQLKCIHRVIICKCQQFIQIKFLEIHSTTFANIILKFAIFYTFFFSLSFLNVIISSFFKKIKQLRLSKIVPKKRKIIFFNSFIVLKQFLIYQHVYTKPTLGHWVIQGQRPV